MKSYEYLDEKTKGGVIGYAVIQSKDGLTLKGVVHGVKSDGTEYVFPGNGGKGKPTYEFSSKALYVSILDAIHNWYDSIGLMRPV